MIILTLLLLGQKSNDIIVQDYTYFMLDWEKYKFNSLAFFWSLAGTDDYTVEDA